MAPVHRAKIEAWSSEVPSDSSRKSCPELNTGPSARRMTTPTSVSSRMASRRSFSAVIRDRERTLRFRGLLRVRMAMPSATS